MKKANNREREDDLRPEYDLAKLKGGVRGKYAKRFQQGIRLTGSKPADVPAAMYSRSHPGGSTTITPCSCGCT